MIDQTRMVEPNLRVGDRLWYAGYLSPQDSPVTRKRVAGLPAHSAEKAHNAQPKEGT